MATGVIPLAIARLEAHHPQQVAALATEIHPQSPYLVVGTMQKHSQRQIQTAVKLHKHSQHHAAEIRRKNSVGQGSVGVLGSSQPHERVAGVVVLLNHP